MHACEWCGADVEDEYDHLCHNCEQQREVQQQAEAEAEEAALRATARILSDPKYRLD